MLMKRMMAVMLWGIVGLATVYGQNPNKTQPQVTEMVTVRANETEEEIAERKRAGTVAVSDLRVPAGVIKQLQRSDKAFRSGDVSGSAGYLERAVEMDPELALAHNALGARYAQLGQFDKAIEQFQKALAANPRYRLAVDNIAALMCVQHRWKDAEEVARRALELEPYAPSAQYLLGATLVEQGQYGAEATKLLESVKGRYVRAWLFLAKAAGGRGEAALAVEEVRAYLRCPEAGDRALGEKWLAKFEKAAEEAEVGSGKE
jgi:tetratricopeptide (TPR) repeat protein